MNMFLTAITEIAMSLRVTWWLEIMSLIVCAMLLSSPGFAGTVIAVGGKLGLVQHMREESARASEAE